MGQRYMWQTTGEATVSVINAATNTPIKKIDVVTDPYGVAVTPDGKRYM